MSIRGNLVGVANRMFSLFSLTLQYAEHDLDRRLVSRPHVDAMLARIAETAEQFLSEEIIFGPCDVDFDVKHAVATFYEDYLALPVHGTAGSSRFLNLLWLALISESMRSRLIVDSGTFSGLSSWALSQGAREATIHSFDINLGQLQQRTRAHYHESDWTDFDFGTVDGQESLCYFDDHVDQVKRILEAHELGFKYLIFDDDVGVGRIPVAAGSTFPLPKLQFIYDDSLEDGTELEWLCRGKVNRFRIDRQYLEQARDRIASIQKLPDMWETAPVMHQNPYTLVVLK